MGKHQFTAAAFAVAVVALTGCMGTPVTSIPSLARIDFETTDVSQLAVAVRVPDGVQSAADGALLTMIISNPDDPNKSQTGRFLMEETGAAKTDPALVSQQRPGARVVSYRLKREDIARFQALRALRFTADGERKQGSLSAMPRLCRTSDWQLRELLVSVYLKTSETGRFVPVVKDRDLRKDLNDETIELLLPMCGQPAQTGKAQDRLGDG
ncbi:MAG: hypothetical protein AAGH82_05000 [Pseudomonadota bacterium]